MVNEKIYISNYKDKSIYESNVVEFWKPITDDIVPGVLSDRYYISSFGNTYNSNTKKEIGCSYNKGNKQISITSIIDGKSKLTTIKLHKCVMNLFAPLKSDNNYQIIHKNGDKLNNELSNLEYCTNSESARIRIDHNKNSIFGNNIDKSLNDDDLDLKYLSFETYIKNN